MPVKLAKNRSPRWAFWDWFEVPDYDDPSKTYLRRLRIVQTPWFGVMLHFLDGPDPRSTLHDHPWNFLSIVLRGGYVESRMEPGKPVVSRIVRRFNFMPRGTAHTIFLVDPNTITLVFTGRRQGPWGYLVESRRTDFNGDLRTRVLRWIRFDVHFHNGEFLAAMKQREEMGL